MLVAWITVCPVVSAEEHHGWQEIYDTPVPAQIRQCFDRAIETHRTCPECALGIVDGEKFLDLYPKKILVVGMEPNDFGGVWATIIAEDQPRQTFLLWLYDIGDNQYELRSVEKLPELLDTALVEPLQTSANRDYWL